MKNAKTSNFFHDKPLFGLDIGQGSLKVMQVEEPGQGVGRRQPKVIGYGYAKFDKAALEDGVIVQPEIIAKAAHELFSHHLIGDITTRRTALAIPAYRTFIRSVSLPLLKPSELRAAVELEAEQYISVPLEELYMDYEVIRRTTNSTELLLVAIPRAITDTYLELTEIMGLETVLIEPTLNSSSRLFTLDSQSDVASLIIDFGSQSSDISIFDKQVMVTGTVQGGGTDFTESIKQKLNVSHQEAHLIKTRYGLSASKRQAEIKQALEPTLQKIAKEIRRMVRYYEERYGTDRPIGQLITLGGGANMPGLTEYLIETMRMPVRHTDPWQYLDYKGLQPPPDADKPMYATVAGLALTQSKEIFKS